MNNAASADTTLTRATDWQGAAMQKRIAKRYAAERRFKYTGMAAVFISSAFLAFLLFVMIGNGLRGFQKTEVALPVDFISATGGATAESISGNDAERAVSSLDLQGVIGTAAEIEYGADASVLFTDSTWTDARDQLLSDPDLITRNETIWVTASAEVDRAAKSDGEPAAEAVYAKLEKDGKVRTSFNLGFLTNSDGTDPARVGIWSALKGTMMTMLVTLALAFPVGVLAAVYLEEYAPSNRLTDLIEVSINNLAAVPSIIFGLLGLVVFLSWMDLPRSSTLVGGSTLALMTMPVIVIAGRNSIKSVPPSIREAALGVGASPVQVVFHHVLPLALPGIMTGTIIGMARALGETAPLLMIGMRAFLTSPPQGLSDPSTVLPVQIYLWSDEVNRGFVEKTSAAIIILLLFLLTMNAFAIYLRNRFETRW